MKYRRTWKADTMKHCELSGTRRMVLGALVLVADFAGRSHKPYRELAQIAGVSTRSCAAALMHLTQAGFVLVIERGTSHRPARLRVVPYEPTTEPTLVQPDYTKVEASLVQSAYVVASVN